MLIASEPQTRAQRVIVAQGTILAITLRGRGKGEEMRNGNYRGLLIVLVVLVLIALLAPLISGGVMERGGVVPETGRHKERRVRRPWWCARLSF
jgi:hypothetical protein